MRTYLWKLQICLLPFSTAVLVKFSGYWSKFLFIPKSSPTYAYLKKLHNSVHYLWRINMFCCFHRSTDWAIWLIYEVVEIQTRSGIATVLDSAAYCYVRLPCLPWYSSPHRSYHMRSFAHPGVVCIQPSIPTSWSASTIPWFPLHDSLPLLPPTPWFPRLRQGCPKLLLCRLVKPPCIPPANSPLLALTY